MIKVKLLPSPNIKVRLQPQQGIKVGVKTTYLYDNSIIDDEVALAKDWAIKTDGMVVEEGEDVDYSSKAYAIGGTGTETNNAKYYAEQAATSEANAYTSEQNAAGSATIASDSATIATNKATAASTSESNALSYSQSAASSANDASHSASDAYNSEQNAASSASTATTQAGIATTKAGDASSYAASALASKTAAATSETNAQIWAEGTDIQVATLGGEKSSKGWAARAKELVDSIGSVLHYKGSVATKDDLPTSGQELGDMYNVLADGSNCVWDGNDWDEISGIVDLSAYRTASDQDTIDEDFVTKNTAQSITAQKTFETSTWSGGIKAKRTSSSGSFVVYENSGGVLGGIGMDGDSKPLCSNSTASAIATLVRSGTNSNPATGSATQPVYVDSDGKAAAITDMATTDTAQTISATKTFSARQDFSSNLSDKIYLKHGQMDITTTPSAKRSNTINFRDKNAVTMGYVTQQQDTDGSSKIRLVAATYETGTTDSVVAAFEVKAYKDGTLETYVPTPAANSDDNNIATTEWVNDKGYASSLDGLSDVTVSSLTSGQYLMWDGTTWKNTSASASVAWGGITGTLTDQTDLNNALNAKADDSDVVHIADAETITGAKTFTQPVTIQNGAGTGTLVFGANVNNSTVTNNTRKLGRINSPSYASSTAPTATLLGWDTQGDTGQDGMHTQNKATDVVAFGGMKKITTNTSPMNIVFCVTDTRGATAAANKIYPLEMDANEARFNVQPNYNGTNLATVNQIPTTASQVGALPDTTTASDIGGANKDLSNLTSTGQNIGNWSSNVSNCITYIPQDIKLELNNGTITLKAGSKVYVPNGFESDGTTPKFDELVLSGDLSPAISPATSTTLALFVRADGSTFDFRPISSCSSGSSDPGTNATHYYNITTNKLICHFGGGGTAEDSFPIALFTTNSSRVITSIDQIFNGFGYVGSTIFTLPGVKGLSPAYKNTDGTYKSDPVELTSVVTQTAASNINGYFSIVIGSANGDYIARSSASYNAELNVNQFSSGADTLDTLIIGHMYFESGKITMFNPKQVFHAPDWNDSSEVSRWSIPSDKYIGFTLGASGATYTAPANGCVSLAATFNAAGYIYMYRYNARFGTTSYSAANIWVDTHINVRKGDVVAIQYPGTASVQQFRFYYAEGEV